MENPLKLFYLVFLIPLLFRKGRYPPLLYPAPAAYSQTPTDQYKAGIFENNVTSQNLTCWLSIYGFTNNDPKSCLNKIAANNYLELLNENLCVGFEDVRKPQKANYPYHPEQWYSLPDYSLTDYKTYKKCE